MNLKYLPGESITVAASVQTSHIVSLTIRAEMIGGDDPFYLKFRVKVTALDRNRRFSIYIRSYRLSRNTCVKNVRDKAVRHSLA